MTNRFLAKRGLIVDGFSTGAFLAPALRAYGVECLHLQSSSSLPTFYSDQLVRSDYVLALMGDKSLDSTLELLRQQEIAFVIPGMDTGVEPADYVSNKLELSTGNS